MSLNAWAVVPAGGSGERFSPTQNKLLVPLAGKPVLLRTLEALAAAQHIEGIVVAAHARALEAYQALIKETDAFLKPIHWVEGGDTRRASVYQSLLALPPEAEIVAIHDAARPLISPALIDQAIIQVQETGSGVVVAVPILDTVKRVKTSVLHESLVIAETVDRQSLWRAQTPQVFPVQQILQAHRQVPAAVEVTDDAQLIEHSGLGTVLLLEGDARNIKITTLADLKMAEMFELENPQSVSQITSSC